MASNNMGNKATSFFNLVFAGDRSMTRKRASAKHYARKASHRADRKSAKQEAAESLHNDQIRPFDITIAHGRAIDLEYIRWYEANYRTSYF